MTTTKQVILPVLCLVLCTTVGSPSGLANITCPGRCDCQLRTVSCKNLKLQNIPTDIPSSVQNLYLDNNLLTHIPADAFSRLEDLVVLSLKGNEITHIDPGAFHGLHHLDKLFLANNNLTVLDEEVLHGLDCLTHLNLNMNEMKTIPDVGLARNLSNINLEYNNFSSAYFPKGYNNLGKLRSVILSGNSNIKNLDYADLRHLKNCGITRFYMSRCSLQRIADNTFRDFNKSFSLKLAYNPDLDVTNVKALIARLSMSKLRWLDLSGMLHSLPADLFSPLSRVPLRYLTLAHSFFETIHNSTFSSLSKLHYLDLSYGKLRETENGAFSGLGNLEKFKLGHNYLMQIPFALPENLTLLDLSYNPLTTVPHQTFSGLSRLKVMSLSHCSLKTVTRYTFVGLDGLTSLDLSHNQISGSNVGKLAFKQTPQLQRLMLDHNNLEATKYDIFKYPLMLQKLYLNSNHYHNMSLKQFQSLGQLEVLHLQDNGLGSLIKSDTGGVLFSKLTALRELHLENNDLTSLPGEMIRSLESLQTLYLQENYISNWGDGFFNGTTSMRMVNLTSNKISYINESSLSGLSNSASATELHLSANPFSCGCDLIWFRDWLDTINSSRISIPDIDQCKCSAPVALAIRPLSEFHPEDIRTKCFPPPWLYIIVGTAVGCVLLVLLLVGLVYVNRWSLRIYKYRFKRWLRHRRASVSAPLDYSSIKLLRYDVYISYGPSEMSRDWVTKVLYPKLTSVVAEDRVFFEEKVSPNRNLYGELADAIYTSCKAILVVTADYLEDSRRIDYEVPLIMDHAASTELRRGLILVLYGKNIGERLPKCLRPLLGYNDLTWPDNETGREALWLQLYDKLELTATRPAGTPNVPKVLHLI